MTENSDPNLYPYRVMLLEDSGDKLQLAYGGMAEDADHAAEQVEEAYPGCEFVSATRLDAEPLSEDEAAAFLRRALKTAT